MTRSKVSPERRKILRDAVVKVSQCLSLPDRDIYLKIYDKGNGVPLDTKEAKMFLEKYRSCLKAAKVKEFSRGKLVEGLSI